MTTVVRVEQSTPVRFSYTYGKHFWGAEYKIDRLRVWTYGPGSGFFFIATLPCPPITS